MLVITTYVGFGTSPILANSNPPPETEWGKTCGGSASEYTPSANQTMDSGYIVAGETSSYGAIERGYQQVAPFA